MSKMKKNSNYQWLIGVELGGLNYDGCAVDEKGLHQYCFIDKNNQLQFMYHKQFKAYISQYDLSQYRKYQ